MLYQLMNKDKVVATYQERVSFTVAEYDEIERHDEYLPYGFRDVNSWIDSRCVGRHRDAVSRLVYHLHMASRHDFIAGTHCASLTDTFWMKNIEESLTWDDISLYRRPFDDAIARISLDSETCYESIEAPISPEFATSGSFAKCWVHEEDQISLMKRGVSGYKNIYFAPHSEVLAAELLNAASIDHVPYVIRNYRNKVASKCPLFTSEEIGFVPVYRFFDRPFDAVNVLAFCREHGGEEPFREMVVMDAVMANVDRHAGNYGFLVDNATGEILRMAPLFDQNMACLPMMMEHDDFDEYVSMIGPKIGGDFVVAARTLLTPDIRAKLVALKDFEYTDPGLGYPAWKLAAVNRLKDKMVADILA